MVVKLTTAIKEDGYFTNKLTPNEIAEDKLTSEMLWKFGRVADAQPSSNGKMVIYNVSRYDTKTNMRHTWIYSVPTEGGEPLNLTPNFALCSNPRWISTTKLSRSLVPIHLLGFGFYANFVI